MTWLREILPQLGVEAEVVTARAEEFVQTRREQYDIATSRAVARLNILAELCLPYVKVGGVVSGDEGRACRRRDRRGPARHRPAWRNASSGVRISHSGWSGPRAPSSSAKSKSRLLPVKAEPPCMSSSKDAKIPQEIGDHPRRKKCLSVICWDDTFCRARPFCGTAAKGSLECKGGSTTF